MQQYILVDPFTHRPYLVQDEVVALEEAVRMNQASENHPAFVLYRTDPLGRGIYVATLARRFGTDNFYWDRPKG